MSITKEFVLQYSEILNEHKIRTSTQHHIVNIVIKNKRVVVEEMFSDAELERLDKHYVHALVYAFVRDNQELFIRE